MALPELIEMVPLARWPASQIHLPGSKSVTNRALILAALSAGETEIDHALWSDDTEVMVDALRALEFEVRVQPDPGEAGNRLIRVRGGGGHLAPGGTAARPRTVKVGNAGTAARFLAALVCLGRGVYRLTGSPRMHERPQAELFAALRQLGAAIETPNEKLPALIHAPGPRPASCKVSLRESSQFASALLLCAKTAGWKVSVIGSNAEESPYVSMTQKLIRAFPRNGGRFAVEPDASSGSYFWAAQWLQLATERSTPISGARRRAWPAPLHDWPATHWQIDSRFPRYLPLPAVVSRETDLGDSILTAMIVAPFGGTPTHFKNLGKLRLQECERVQAMRTELGKCGAAVRETGDELRISPSTLHGATIETYEDHRIAMCFATLGLKTPGIKIKNPRCVRKTFPNFFQKLSAPPPEGLGAVILDGTTGRRITKWSLASFP